MTEQKESRIRLLRDNKILGYIIFKDGNIIYRPTVSDELKWDSFNLSFKFGGKWIFEGDKVEIKYSDTIYPSIGIIEFNESQFVLKTRDLTPSIANLTTYDTYLSITVTGNIYEVSHENS